MTSDICGNNVRQFGQRSCRPSRALSHNAHVPGAACVAPRRPDPWLKTDAPSGACLVAETAFQQSFLCYRALTLTILARPGPAATT